MFEVQDIPEDVTNMIFVDLDNTIRSRTGFGHGFCSIADAHGYLREGGTRVIVMIPGFVRKYIQTNVAGDDDRETFAPLNMIL